MSTNTSTDHAGKRSVPWPHWEGDLIAGSNNSHIATLVERQSRFVMLVKVPGKDTEGVVKSLTRRVQSLPKQLRRSITWDRCKEMADHKGFSLSTDIKVHFCDPHSPCYRPAHWSQAMTGMWEPVEQEDGHLELKTATVTLRAFCLRECR